MQMTSALRKVDGEKASEVVKISNLNSKIKAQRVQIDQLEFSLLQKSKQLDDERETHTKLLALVESNAYDLMSKNRQITVYANTVHSLSEKTEGLRNLIGLLKENLKRKGAEWKCLEGRLQVQIEDLQSKLLAEKPSNVNVVEKHEILTSTMSTKTSHLVENTVTGCISIDKDGSTEDKGQAIKNIGLPAHNAGRSLNSDTVKHLDDHFEDGKNNKSNKSSHMSSTKPQYFSHDNNCPVKSQNKRTASTWINTRAHRIPRGPDPHDDFLDTPFEIIKDSLKKDKIVEAQVSEVKSLKSIQNVFSDVTPEKPMDPLKKKLCSPSSKQSQFKYVDTVRKKRERENLKGVQCKQYTKFYDDVLPNNEATRHSGSGGVICEHHQGVSRHRYKHIPPMTPEGFWNIGFDSEL